MNNEETPSHYRLKFGRHKGQLISKTGRTYLEWLYRQPINSKLLPEDSRKLIATRIGVEYQPLPQPHNAKTRDGFLTEMILLNDMHLKEHARTLSGANKTNKEQSDYE